jgi:hypothetical protein
VQAAFRGYKERRRLPDQKRADAEAKESTNTGLRGWVSGLVPNGGKGKPVVEEPAPEQSWGWISGIKKLFGGEDKLTTLAVDAAEAAAKEGQRRPAFGKQRTKMRGYV